MEKNEDIQIENRKISSKAIVTAVRKRGWDITGFDSTPGVFLIEIPGKIKPIYIYSSSPPTTPYSAVKITNDKRITNMILGSNDIPVPAEILINGHPANFRRQVEAFLSRYKKAVFKPLSESHGNGINANITQFSEVEDSYTSFAGDSKVKILLQEFVEGDDVRIILINHKFVGAVSRRPAYVVGDGVRTTGELIQLENQSGNRSENYKTPLNVIPLDRAQRFLGEAIHDIPPSGSEVTVVDISNIGVGGVSTEVTADIPDFLIKIAEDASQYLQLPVCGIDFLVSGSLHNQASSDSLQAKIIEVNACPSLIYPTVSGDVGEDFVEHYIDYLAEL